MMKRIARFRAAPAQQGLGLVLLATVGFGLNPLFARWAYGGGLTAETALLYRFIVPSLGLLPFVWGGGHLPRAAGRAILLGMFIGLGTVTYFRALAVVPVATAALVYFSHPLFTVVLGWLFFRTAVTRASLLSMGLVLAACAIILSPVGLSAEQLAALLVSFLAPLSFAVLLLGFEHWLAVLPLMPRIALANWGQVAVILPFLLVMPSFQIAPSNPTGWWGVIGLASVGSVLPQALMAAGIPLTGATRTSIVGSAELVTSLLVGWLILAEPVYLREAAGAVLILGAIFVSRS